MTSKWWKEERGSKVFIDYNQNARDRTIASAYSARKRQDATVSTPLTWSELPDVQTEDFTIATMPARFAKVSDVHAAIDDVAHDLTPLLEWYARDERDRGEGDMPYLPNYPKMPGEPKRVQPKPRQRLIRGRAQPVVRGQTSTCWNHSDMDIPWLDPQADWWVKRARAEEHLHVLAEVVTEFRALDPYLVVPEPTDDPDMTAYRLHIRHPVPVAVSTITGDMLHNLRSALDSLAYAMAMATARRDLRPDEERHVAFPISLNPAKFDGYVTDKKRAHLFDEPTRQALRRRQSFSISEQVTQNTEPERQAHYADEFKWSTLPRLAHLNNVDKHRHLAIATWWPSLAYWTSDGTTERRLYAGDGTVIDGSVLWHMRGTDEGGSDLQHEFALVLSDDTGHAPHQTGYDPTDCVALLRGMWHEVGMTMRYLAADLKG